MTFGYLINRNGHFSDFSCTYRIMMVGVHVSNDTSLCCRILRCLITHVVCAGSQKTHLERDDDINVSWLAAKDPEDQITKPMYGVEAPFLTRWSKVVTYLCRSSCELHRPKTYLLILYTFSSIWMYRYDHILIFCEASKSLCESCSCTILEKQTSARSDTPLGLAF
jgi:hypothetical protein